MDKEVEAKYERYKRTVVKWEHEFKKNNHRIPSKVSSAKYFGFFYHQLV